MENFKEQAKKLFQHETLCWLILLALLPIAYFNYMSFVFILFNFLVPVFLFLRAKDSYKETKDRTPWVWAITTLLLSFAYMLFGYSSGNFMTYSLLLCYMYCLHYKKDWYGVILAVYIAPFVMCMMTGPDVCWTPEYMFPLILYNLAVISLLTACFGLKGAAGVTFACHALFRAANMYFSAQRYSYISIMDVFALPTFFNVAGQYRFTWNGVDTVLLILFIVSILPFLFMSNYRMTHRLRWGLAAGVMSITVFFGIGYKTKLKWENPLERGIYFLDYLAMSAVEQVRFLLDTPDVEEQKVLVNAYSPDEKPEVQPNIITVMCESYCDVVDIRDLTVSEDPLTPLWEFAEESPNTTAGSVMVNTIGGGTSVSEWEYLTGLNHSLLSESRIPFFTDCEKNYTFTADPLYEDYYVQYMHPFRSSGWNRVNVYQNFEYDEVRFHEDDGTEYQKDTDYLRHYVSDEALYKTIVEEIEKHDEPLFSMNVTMQNHGGYGEESDAPERPMEHTITVEDDLGEEQYAMETYLELMKRSTDAILELTKYLEEHPEEPTVLIFFGDHYPSDIKRPDATSKYATPYLVYSNIGNVEEMKEELDLSLLYPEAKNAAGLPLTSWEKYLLSLDGKTADREMIISRIRNGSF